jgi:hypothetical protein
MPKLLDFVSGLYFYGDIASSYPVINFFTSKQNILHHLTNAYLDWGFGWLTLVGKRVGVSNLWIRLRNPQAFYALLTSDFFFIPSSSS